MSLNKILNIIKTQSEKEIEQLKQEKESKKEEILKNAQTKAKKIKVQALNNFEIQAKNEVREELYRLKQEGYRAILKKKKEILDKVFHQALLGLKNLDGADKEALMDKLRKNLPKEGEIREEGEGGFKFVSDSLEIDNTFSALISEARANLETEVARILF